MMHVAGVGGSRVRRAGKGSSGEPMDALCMLARLPAALLAALYMHRRADPASQPAPTVGPFVKR